MLVWNVKRAPSSGAACHGVPPSEQHGGGIGVGVLAVLGHLHQLVDGVQQAVAVLPQQPLVELLVPEAHLQQHRHQGGVLSGGRVDGSLRGGGKKIKMDGTFL